MILPIFYRDFNTSLVIIQDSLTRIFIFRYQTFTFKNRTANKSPIPQFYGNRTTRRQTNSRSVKSRTSQLAKMFDL